MILLNELERRPTGTRLNRFVVILQEAGLFVQGRKGTKINASCGQHRRLAKQEQELTEVEPS